MSEEPTTPDLEEVVRRVVEAASRREYEAALAAHARDSVWDMSPLGMGVFEGHDAIRNFFSDWIGAYEDHEIELDEFCDLGNGVSFAAFVQCGRPAGSTGLVELRYATVGTWAHGLIERSTNYTDIAEAHAAAERLAKERG